MKLEYTYGQTPIDEEESNGLLVKTISTLWELDEFEQLNIEEFRASLMGRKLKAEQVFADTFIKDSHRKMYGQEWSWAGKYRLTDKNLGIDKWKITQATKQLCDDALYWSKSNAYPWDELAILFKHRLVSIHCFPNGNGRHSRMIADIINENIFGNEKFTWGSAEPKTGASVRKEYINALKLADKGDLQPLLRFAKS